MGYVPQYINMSDTCKGEIGFSPTSTYQLQVCLQKKFIIYSWDPNNYMNLTMYETCKNYTANIYSKNIPIYTSDFDTGSIFLNQTSSDYRFMIHWNRIQYKNMNNSLINNYNDTGLSSSVYYPNCQFSDPICNSDGIYYGFLLGSYPQKQYFYNPGDCSCSGTNFSSGFGGTDGACKYVESAKRIYEGYIRSGGSNATLGTLRHYYSAKFYYSYPDGDCHGVTYNCGGSGISGNYDHYIAEGCVAGTEGSYPISLCSFAGNNVAYSNYFTLNLSASTYSNINFSEKVYSNGTLYAGSILLNASINNYNMTSGFVNSVGIINVSCTSNFNISINTSVYFNNVLIGSNISSSDPSLVYNVNWLNGNNNVLVTCTDTVYGYKSNVSQNINAIVGYLFLVDEKSNVLFNVANLSIARVYVDDNSSVYDFKASGTNQINYSSSNYSKLRFELGLYGTNIITRYIDVSVLNNTVRVCANKDDVNHYEQLLTSGVSTRAVLMRSIYANCYIAADYTRFAYQDGWLLKAFSIGTPYYVYTYIEGVPSYLAGIDGSIASYINIDSLIFKSTAYNTNVISDGLSVYNDLDTLLLDIFYINLKNTATKTNIKITNQDDNSILYNQDETLSPNNFYVYYNYAGLVYDNDTVLKIESTTYKSSTVINTQTIYIYLVSGSTNVKKIPVGLGIMITVGLLIFGFTFTSSSRTFGWLGIFILIINIIILAFTKSSIYVTVLIGVYFIILIFTFLILLTGKDVKQEVG
jgi:hypothetical protein